MKWTQKSPASVSAALAGLAQKALAQAPENGQLWHALGNRLMEAEQPHAAAAALREAVSRLPGNLRASIELIDVLILIDAFEEALAVTERALAVSPGNLMARLFRFDLLMRLERHTEALALADEAAELNPSNPLLLRLWASSREPGRLEALLEHCDNVLAVTPGNTPATHIKAMTLAQLGRDNQACRNMPFREFLSISEMAPPPGYESKQAFCAALADEMRRNSTFIVDGRAKVTERTYVSTFLEQPGDQATPWLRQMFQQAVEDYAARLPLAPDGFAAARPKAATLHVWGVINKGQEGRLGAHYHGNAWLSGVYYVAAGRQEEGGAYCGPLVLGAVDKLLAPRAEAPWEKIQVNPVPGTLVLFPSYVPHATQPSGVDSERICISFDIIPSQSMA